MSRTISNTTSGPSANPPTEGDINNAEDVSRVWPDEALETPPGGGGGGGGGTWSKVASGLLAADTILSEVYPATPGREYAFIVSVANSIPENWAPGDQDDLDLGLITSASGPVIVGPAAWPDNSTPGTLHVEFVAAVGAANSSATATATGTGNVASVGINGTSVRAANTGEGGSNAIYAVFEKA